METILITMIILILSIHFEDPFYSNGEQFDLYTAHFNQTYTYDHNGYKQGTTHL